MADDIACLCYQKVELEHALEETTKMAVSRIREISGVSEEEAKLVFEGMMEIHRRKRLGKAA